ncbi:DUF732 domain-containing protein [Rhodococcus sp. B50]|uniref:DUF732 domain-containing protein n=1 Tax=Rhodococcus sp. B50 TaxID=2682847 RepID=UPI001A0D9462|nr:DUF732 domain-containing protein [Rhodococcus sp. B50]MBS9374322.1 hypothetical protein [Rhodococcus sp. B50]
MRTFVSIALASATALALAACGGNGGAEGGEDTYIARLGEAGIDTGDRDALLAVGEEICDHLRTNADSADGNASATDLVVGFTEPARKAGYDPLDAVTISMASVTSLCSDALGEETSQEIQKQWDEFVTGRNALSDSLGG